MRRMALKISEAEQAELNAIWDMKSGPEREKKYQEFVERMKKEGKFRIDCRVIRLFQTASNERQGLPAQLLDRCGDANRSFEISRLLDLHLCDD